MEHLMPGFCVLFFFIAFFYSMAGFGGGSSYLAAMVLLGLPFQSIRPIGLFCNVIVTLSGFRHFYTAGYFKPERALPFVALSVPMAYIGGRLVLNDAFFRVLLGVSLFSVALRIALPGDSFRSTISISRARAWFVGLPVGALLGFISGLVGIGGGIFLSPILLLMRWVNAKEAAACASFFILVNSLAGLSAQWSSPAIRPELLILPGLSVFLGGQLGSRLSAYRLPFYALEKVLAVLIFYVSAKLLWGI